MTAALQLQNVRVGYPGPSGTVSAVDDVSLRIERGELVGLVGESGCGKSTLANAVMGLLPEGAQVSGSITVAGEELANASPQRLRELRGRALAMVFQDPATSLDPTFSIGSQVREAVLAHQRISRKAATERAVELLTQVGIPDAAARFGTPPHRFSGGMRQRVVIAAALANDPALLLADEPTTALDVTIQAQILMLMQRLAREHDTAVVIITHNLGVVAQTCDRIAVMYAGQLVEQGTTAELFAHPRHPYTRALLAALPTSEAEPGQLAVIPGQVPDLSGDLPGCRFFSRCPLAHDRCHEKPPLVQVGGAEVACWAVEEGRDE
ncbi:MAG TPA: ABC transporter ATP-binding protein [Angustibacter sp.]|nr:ABC transporter ATP-binding protein [Angustibacter sp.]